MTGLADVLAELDDPRAVNARHHSLHEILVIALCTVVSGGLTRTGMELFGHAKRHRIVIQLYGPRPAQLCERRLPGGANDLSRLETQHRR